MDFLLANKAVEFYSLWDGRWHNGKIIGCDVINSTYHLLLQGCHIQHQVERKFLRNVGSHWNNWYDMLSVKTKVKCIESGQLGTIWHIDDNGHATIMFENERTELKVKPHLYCIVNDETGEELSFLPNDENDEDDITNAKGEPSCVPMVTDEDDDFCSDSLHSSSQSQPHSHSDSLCLYSDSLLGEEEYEMEVAMECESDSDSEVPEVQQPKPQLSQQPQLSRREVVDLSQSPELPDETGETPPATEYHHCHSPATPLSPMESVARPFIPSSDPLTSHHHQQHLFSTEEVAPTHRVTTYGVDPPPLVSPPAEESFIAGNHQEEAEKAVATTQRDVPQFPVFVNQQQISSTSSSAVSLPLFGAKISPAGEASRSAAENVNSAGASMSFGEGGAGGAVLHREETSESGRDPLLNNRSRCEEGTKQEASAVSCYEALPEYDRKYLNYLKNSLKNTYTAYDLNIVLHSLNTTQLLSLEVYTLRNLVFRNNQARESRVAKLPNNAFSRMNSVVWALPSNSHCIARNCLVDLFLSLSPEEQQDLTSDKLLRMAKQWQATKHIILPYTAPPLEPRMITLSCPELDTTAQTADLNELLKTREPKYNRFKEFKARVLDLVGYTKTFRHEDNLKNPASSYYINIKKADEYVDNVAVFRVRKGWSVEVGEDTEASACESVFFNNLQAGHLLEVRRFGVAFVGGKFRLSSIAAAERFNESLQTKVAELSQQYVGFRKIRGDGNCYYRAIVFGLLEFVIVSGHRHMLRQMYDCFSSVLYDEWTKEYQHHQKLLTHLQLAIGGQCWQTVAEFEHDLLLSGSGLDQTIVRACKHVVANMLVARQLEVCNGMTVQDAVLLAYDDISSVESFCEKYVLRMEVCAEGIHVNLGVLPSALGCHCTIVLLPRDRDSRIATIENKVAGEGETAGSSLCTLHLLLRPGHYDLLYTAAGPGIDVSDPDIVFVPPAPLPASAGSSTAASTPISAASTSASSYEESYPTLPAKTTRSGTLFSMLNPLSWIPVDNKKATGKRKGNEFESLYKSPQFHRDVQKIIELCGVTETEAEDLRRKFVTVDFALEQYFSKSDTSSSAVVAQDVLNEGKNANLLGVASDECASDAACSSGNEMMGESQSSTSEHFRRYATHVPSDSTDNMLAPLPATSPQLVQLTPVEQVMSFLSVAVRTAEKLLALHVTPERAIEAFLGFGDAQKESFAKDALPAIPSPDTNAKVPSDGKSSAAVQKISHVKMVPVSDPETANMKRIESNMAKFTEYRLLHTRLSHPPRAELVLRLANDLQFKLDDVVDAVVFKNFCNVYAYIRFKRAESIGSNSGLTKEDIIECTPDRDAQLVALYTELISRGFDRREVLDAIAFDRCTSVEDAEDVLTDTMKTRLEGLSASTPSLRNLSRVFNRVRSRDDSAPRIAVSVKTEWSYSFDFEPKKYQVPDPDSLHLLGRSAILRALAAEPLSLKAGDLHTQSTRGLRALLQAQLVANYERVKPPTTVTKAMSAMKSLLTDHIFPL